MPMTAIVDRPVRAISSAAAEARLRDRRELEPGRRRRSARPSRSRAAIRTSARRFRRRSSAGGSSAPGTSASSDCVVGFGCRRPSAARSREQRGRRADPGSAPRAASATPRRSPRRRRAGCRRPRARRRCRAAPRRGVRRRPARPRRRPSARSPSAPQARRSPPQTCARVSHGRAAPRDQVRAPVSFAYAEGADRRRAAEHGRRRPRRQREPDLRRVRGRAAAGADLVVFPELTITGYPPEDLLLRPAFVARGGRGAREARGPHRRDRGDRRVSRSRAATSRTRPRFSRTAACRASTASTSCPNYAVFDEQRYFVPGDDYGPLFVIAGVRVARLDLRGRVEPDRTDRAPGRGRRRARRQPQRVAVLRGPAPRARDDARDARGRRVGARRVREPRRWPGRARLRRRLARRRRRGRARRAREAVRGRPPRRRPRRAPHVPQAHARPPRPRHGRSRCPRCSSPRRTSATGRSDRAPPASSRCYTPVREVYEALVLGTRDYVRKNGFSDVHIGLSGGVDSAIVAMIAVDALGAEHVTGVLMPSRFSSDHSVTDAEAIAANLGIATLTVPIEPAHAAFESMLADVLATAPPGLAEENVQSRIRGNVLMTISNKLGSLVLTTGNKSEMATGYATLYGDMVGGFAVIKDVPEDARVRAVRRAQRARRSRADPGERAHEAAERRAATRSEGHRFAPRLRRARPDPRGLRRGRPRGRPT